MEEVLHSGSLLPDEVSIQLHLETEPSVEGQELENSLPFYRFSMDTGRKRK